jgi:RNA-binding protein YlmH
LNKEQLLGHLRSEEERQLGSHVVDLARLAWDTNRPQVTDFYDPYERKVAESVLSGIPEVGMLQQGGYRDAERARLVIYPQLYLVETIPSALRVLEASGNFSFQSVSHRDYLGSLMSTGLKRSKIGDILVLPEGCQVVVAAEVADYLLTHWDRVHQVPISVREIDEEQLAVEPERIKEIKATVASLRLDAVAAEGFGMSRTKMAREIKAERVKLNWRPESDPSADVREGDVLSMRGRGRVVVSQVSGKTRKGRTSIVLHRYY